MSKRKLNKDTGIKFIYDCMITKGMTSEATKRLFVETYQLSDLSFYNYYSEYKKFLQELYKQNMELIVEENLNRLKDLYEKAIKKGDIRNAREIIKEINNLTGITKQKIEIEGNLNHNIQVIKLVEYKNKDEE